MTDSSATRVASLYIHVPFCAQKCAYCAFYSEASSGELVNRYVSALVRELEIIAGDLKPKTIFFGGGTPSLLNRRQWEKILRAMARLNLLGAEEFTVECNPATVSLDKAKLLHDFGVNRVSMGVQSLDETMLERLGRIHSREQVFRSFHILRRSDFDNLNLDLMFAIPGQTMAVWRDTLNQAITLESEHLSTYEVIYEDDTPLFQRMQAGEFDVDEELACKMYEELIMRATASGFRQYEVANFAKDEPVTRPSTALSQSNGEKAGVRIPPKSLHIDPPNRSRRREETLTSVSRQGMSRLTSAATRFMGTGAVPFFACKHNVNYWRGGSFYGLGPSATSYVRGVRTKNWSNTRLYCEQLERGTRAIESSEELAPLKRAGETAAFGLRMNAGWPFEDFRRVTSFDLRDEWNSEMNQLTKRGWGKISPDHFQLTPQGLRFADTAAEMFLR